MPLQNSYTSRAAWFVPLAPTALYLMTVLLFRRQAYADGYDGVGFVLALDKIDLQHFAPQPPGYPLFVALGRILHACGMAPGVALAAINAVFLGAGIASLSSACKREAGPYAGALCAALLTLSPLVWVLGIATLSDGAGLGVLLLAIGLLARRSVTSHCAGGALVGLALGIRPSYAPLATLLVFLFGMRRGLRAGFLISASALIAIACWLIPFALWIGPTTLWQLSTAHLQGHLTVFGGTVASDPALGTRISALLRGLCEGAFGPLWPLVFLLLGAALWLVPWRQLSPAARQVCAYLVIGLVSYALFAWLALRVREQARHLLPIVVAQVYLASIILGKAIEVSASEQRAYLPKLGIFLFLAILGGTSARAIWLFRQPSPGLQLAEFVRAKYPQNTLLYGTTAARYLDLFWGSGSAHQTLYFGNIMLEAERLNQLPAEVLVTSEVMVAPGRSLRTVARFCIDDRLPKVMRLESYPSGCVELYAFRFLP